MFGRVEALYSLQLIDTEADEVREALARVESEREANEEASSARGKLSQEEEALRQSRAQLRSLELDLEEIGAKIESTREMLYGGRVTNPKELAGLEQEVGYLERRRSDVEEKTLETMEDVEDKEASFKAAEEHWRRVERECEEKQGRLGQQAGELQSRLTDLEAARRLALREVPEADLSVYEDLRRRKGGQAMALLKDGICQGCRVAMPTSLVQKVRKGDELIYCGSCRRILHSVS